MEHLIRKLWRKLSSVNSLSRTLSGVTCLMRPRTLSRTCSQKTRTRDHLQNRHLCIHGSRRSTSCKSPIWVLMLQPARWKIFKHSMPPLNLSRLPMHSLHPSFCRNRRRLRSIKFSVQWMSMAMVNCRRRKSRTDMLSSSERVLPTSKSMRCSLRSMLTVMERSTTLSSSLLPWTRRVS